MSGAGREPSSRQRKARAELRDKRSCMKLGVAGAQGTAQPWPHPGQRNRSTLGTHSGGLTHPGHDPLLFEWGYNSTQGVPILSQRFKRGVN